MVEISTAAVSSSLKVGLHVVSNYKRPVLEIYHQVCNRFGPEYEIDSSEGRSSHPSAKFKIRPQNIFVQFTLVNIGGMRAENVELTISGALRRRPPRDFFKGPFENIIPQFPPGQSHFLFSFDNHDFNEYANGEGPPIGIRKDSFTITISYDAPPGILNWILAIPSKLRGKRRFTNFFTFSPQLVEGDLPPAEYIA